MGRTRGSVPSFEDCQVRTVKRKLAAPLVLLVKEVAVDLSDQCCMVADEIEERLMDAGVVGELGMEGCGQHTSLPDRDGVGALSRDDFDARADAGNFWSAD